MGISKEDAAIIKEMAEDAAHMSFLSGIRAGERDAYGFVSSMRENTLARRRLRSYIDGLVTAHEQSGRQ